MISTILCDERDMLKRLFHHICRGYTEYIHYQYHLHVLPRLVPTSKRIPNLSASKLKGRSCQDITSTLLSAAYSTYLLHQGHLRKDVAAKIATFEVINNFHRRRMTSLNTTRHTQVTFVETRSL